MINVPRKFQKYMPSGRVDIAAVLSIVVSSMSDPQSSRSDWDSGNQLDADIVTSLGAGIGPTDTVIPVASTDGFTAAGADHPAWIVVTDGAGNYEVIEYGDNDGTNFRNAVRGAYGTAAGTWNSGDMIIQLTVSHGSSPSYDLQPQQRNWWTHLGVAGGPPLQRVGHGWVYRPADGCFYMFGGYASDGNHKNDLWKFDPSGKSWTQVLADGAVGNPARRAYMACVFNESADEIWVFGGEDAVTQYRDVHKYDFASPGWSTSCSWDAGSDRSMMQACYDRSSGRMIVCGGMKWVVGPDEYKSNCWVFDGSSWETKNAMPVSLAMGAGCWMSAEGRFFAVGRTSGGAYKAMVYDPLTDRWEGGPIANPPSSVRTFPACCYDTASRKVLLFGGEVSGSGKKGLWVYHYASNSWARYAPCLFDNGADGFARHGFAWDAANNTAVAWGGWTDSTPTWHIHDSPVYFRHYHSGVRFMTRVMDVGDTPALDGVWNLEDVYDFLGGSSGLVYTAEYSDDASDWTCIGTVRDGDAITEKHRYYRVTATMNCGGDDPPRVLKIDSVFDEVLEAAMAKGPPGGRLPALKSVGNISSSIDPMKCSAGIGAVTFELLDSGKIMSKLMSGACLAGKTVKLRIGPDAADVSPDEYVTIFTGVVDTWEYDGSTILISARDFMGSLERDIPAEDTGGGLASLAYNAGGLASHPVDILLDILRNRVNVPDRHIDMTSFDEVKADASIASWAFNRIIADPTDAHDLCLDICRHIGAVLIPREDGRIALKMLSAAAAPVDSWDDMWSNFKRPVFKANLDSLRNFVSTWWHWDGSGDSWSDFEGAEVAVDATSVADWGTRVIRTKSKWLGDDAPPYNGDQLAAAISSRILNTAREGLPTVSLEADIGTFAAQVGDVVRVRSSVVSNDEVYRDWMSRHNPSRDFDNIIGDTGRSALPYLAPQCSECVDMLWWVTRKRIDVNRGVVKWELTRCRRMPLAVEYTTQEDLYKGSGENVDLEANPGSVQLAEQSPGVYFARGDCEILFDMGQQPERAGEWGLSISEPSGTSVTFRAWASETGRFTGEEIYLGEVWDGDGIDVKTRFYKLAATLESPSPYSATPTIDGLRVEFPC